MKIIIKESNRAKIEEMIREAEGKATARTITADCIMNAVKHIEAHLDIPKKAMIGITAEVDPWAQNFPKAYKYEAYSTQFAIAREPSGWILYYVCRAKAKRASQAAVLTLPETAQAAIIARASTMSSYEI